MGLSCFCATEVAADTKRAKGSEILPRAQNADGTPHLPEQNSTRVTWGKDDAPAMREK